MAVDEGHAPVIEFEQWYVDYDPAGGRDGELAYRAMKPCADTVWHMYQVFKREMDARVHNYGVLDKLADGEVISEKPDLPNVSSGETAGLVRRVIRNVVQNTPNVDVISCFDDDDVYGLFAKHMLVTKVIGDDLYSNDMQQNLSSTARRAFALGFSTVIPVLQQDAANGWYMKYDTIHYRDVFPEPGAKDIRTATKVFIRRYLTRGEAIQLIRDNAVGWDVNALKLMIKTRPPSREMQSVDHQTAKHGQIPEGYEIITQYTSDGNPFLTFDARNKVLLRIEKNKHPLKWHPVHFLVLERDEDQPLGKSQVELLVGRQDFQDLMLNGAMKLWYRNINPSIIGYGTVNSIPNLSPGKYTQIANPNAKVEAFEVNTQTLMQFGTISEQNLGAMVNLVGAADQQMAMQAGNGMSATPQGVEAQTALVDITTNNYQKAIESFFSHYCSYALTIFFQELKSVKRVSVTADARTKLLAAGLDPTLLDIEYESDGVTVKKPGDYLEMDFEKLAVEYWVRCVPGSLTEMEDEKQLRVLNQLFIPLSQAMPALASTQDQRMLSQATAAMVYIIEKQIALSGATSSKDIGAIFGKGATQAVDEKDARIEAIEAAINGSAASYDVELQANTSAIQELREQNTLITENLTLLLQKLGVTNEQSDNGSATPEVAGPSGVAPVPESPTVYPASA